jgi:hypothetical protein
VRVTIKQTAVAMKGRKMSTVFEKDMDGFLIFHNQCCEPFAAIEAF